MGAYTANLTTGLTLLVQCTVQTLIHLKDSGKHTSVIMAQSSIKARPCEYLV
jgi:hypothetical protein